MQGGLEVQVLAARQEVVECGLPQRGPDGGPHQRPLVHDIVARHLGRAARGWKERRQHQDGRGLACAVRSEEAVDLTPLDAQVYALHGPRSLPELPDEVIDLYPPLH